MWTDILTSGGRTCIVNCSCFCHWLPRYCEAFTSKEWLYRDPLSRKVGNNYKGDFPKHPRDKDTRSSVAIGGLAHVSHKDEADKCYQQKAYNATLILGKTNTWRRDEKCAEIVYEQCRLSTLVLLPDRYVVFAIEPSLTREQSHFITENRDTEFSYYFLDESNSGSYAFHHGLYMAVKKYSELRGSTALYIKAGGTSHCKYETVYILVVCAFLNDRDPLQQLPIIDESAVLRMECIFQPGSFADATGRVNLGSKDTPPLWATNQEDMPRFAPYNPCKSIGNELQHYDTLEIAFHFPSGILVYPKLTDPEPVYHRNCAVNSRTCLETRLPPVKKRKVDVSVL